MAKLHSVLIAVCLVLLGSLPATAVDCCLELGTLASGDSTRRIFAQTQYIYQLNLGTYAYLADNENGLRLVNVSVPAQPVEESRIPCWGESCRAVGGSAINSYLLMADSRLRIFDISQPSAPVEQPSVHMGWGLRDVFHKGTYAYLADGALRVIDLDVDDGPAEIGSTPYDNLNPASAVFVQGSIAYLTRLQGGLDLIDVSDPTAPVVLGNYPSTDASHDVYVAGYFAYLADGVGGLKIIDVSDPTAPTLIGGLPPADSGDPENQAACYSVQVVGRTCFIADGYGGCRIIDLTDKTVPTVLGTMAARERSLEMTVLGNRAYLSEGEAGMRIIDVSSYRDYLIDQTVDLRSYSLLVFYGLAGEKLRVSLTGSSGTRPYAFMEGPGWPGWYVPLGGAGDSETVITETACGFGGRHLFYLMNGSDQTGTVDVEIQVIH